MNLKPSCRSFAPRALLGVLFFSALSTQHSAFAQEVQWRYDYNAARREAEAMHRPLMIDFGTENCFWCKRLDASTFHEATVAGVLNERFIPLKIDADRDAQLAQSLNIQSYPTIVLATPDGKILGTVVGFKEAGEFHGILQRALASIPAAPVVKAPPPAPPAEMPTPDWMTHDFEEAATAVAHSEYAKALSLLKGLLEDGKDRPVQARARQLIQDLEQQAAGRLVHSRQLEDNGQTTEAVSTLTELLRQFPGTQAAVEGGQMLTVLAAKPDVKGDQRRRRARELLAQAREDYRTQQYLCCLDRCDVLTASYADLPEGSEAMQLSSEIKNNPEWMRQACENLSERLGSLYLSLAETWLRKEQPQQAILCLERVIQTFPGTRQAEAAQVRLSYIKGQTMVQTEYKKP
jgi:thioredoxin-related protein